MAPGMRFEDNALNVLFTKRRGLLVEAALDSRND